MSASRFWTADSPEIMIRGSGGRGKGKLGSWSGRSPGVGWGRGVGGDVIIPWPHGTDALWDKVVFMVDWKEMAKRANPGDTVFDETGNHEFLIPANATLSETTGLTVTTAIAIPDSDDWYTGSGGGGFCVECYANCAVGGWAFAQLDWGSKTNSNIFMVRLGDGTYYNGWHYGNTQTSMGHLNYVDEQTHICINSQGSWGWAFYNGVLVSGDSTNIENSNNSNLTLIISSGTYTGHRWTKGARRYGSIPFTPDAVFGKGLPE